nr:unnamed protein product [Trichobilharzia regenti]
MFVCTYKLRCISFEHFEEMTKWDDILKANLTCSYFHADLIVAPKDSLLHSYACHRKRFRITVNGISQPTVSPKKLCYGVSNTSTDGYLHVTRDRICFTTGPGCSHPRLLATWTFDNDEIVQCGTARIRNPVNGTFNDPPSLFFLTASPDHPEAPGCHLFLSDRAGDLCDIIEHTNRAAVYQADWRRLTCMAALIDPPLSPKEYNLNQNGYVCDATKLNMSFSCANTIKDFEISSYCKGSDKCNGDEFIGMSMRSIPPAESSSKIEVVQVGIHTDNQIDEDSRNTTGRIGIDSHPVSFCDRKKWVAMHPRRRFSSHPVESCNTDIDSLTRCKYNSKLPSKLIKSNDSRASDTMNSNSSKSESLSTDQFEPNNYIPDKVKAQSYMCSSQEKCSHCHWRRSEPYLVTLPSQPLDIQKLKELLNYPSGSCCSMSESCNCNTHSSHSPNNHDLESNHFSNSGIIEDDRDGCQNCTDKPNNNNNSNNENSYANDLSSNYCTQNGIHIQSGTSCHTTQCDTVSTQSKPSKTNTVITDSSHLKLCHDITNDNNKVIANNVNTLLNTTQPVCAQNVNQPIVPSVVNSNVINTAARRRRRLPSSWSTLSSTLIGNTDVSGNTTNGHTLSNMFTNNRRQTQLNQRQSKGNSTHHAYIPYQVTPTVIPGSQCIRTRQHTNSTCESTTSCRNQAYDSSYNSPDSLNTYCQTSSRGSIKSSLVSLSPNLIPLWANAPTFAKPRTGRLYVSREEVLARIAEQRRHLSSVSEVKHQEGFNNRSPPNSSDTLSSHFGDNSNCPGGTGTSSNNSTEGNSTSYSEQKLSNNPVQSMAPNHNPVTTNGCNFDLSSDSLIVCKNNASLPIPSASYINMPPNPINSGLKPANEKNSSVVTSDAPVQSVESSDITDKKQNIEDTSKVFSGSDSIFELSDGTHVVLGNPETYVNLLGLRRSGFTILNHSEAKVYYINLSPPNFESTSDHPGPLQLSSSQTDCQDPNLSQYQRSVIPKSLSLPRVPPSVPILPASLFDRPPPPLRLVTPNNVTSKIPQLHYAHLMLPDNPSDCFTIGARHDKKATQPSEKKDSSCENVHSVQSLPPAISSHSIPSETNEFLNCNCNQLSDQNGDFCSQEVNYVTIDMRQTKALSELEQELRISGEPMRNSGLHRLWSENHRYDQIKCANTKSGNKISELRKHFTISWNLPNYIVKRKEETTCGITNLNRNKQNQENVSSSLTSRFLNRIIHSFHLRSHNHH